MKALGFGNYAFFFSFLQPCYLPLEMKNITLLSFNVSQLHLNSIQSTLFSPLHPREFLFFCIRLNMKGRELTSYMGTES